MKIIFSRKGFDAENGGVASPIFDDNRICSLPIPFKRSSCTFNCIRFGNENLGRVAEDLTRRKGRRIAGDDPAHLDPDLRKDALRRKRGWLPTFGPGGVAQTNLEREGVEVGDLFLFYGWFRRSSKEDDRFVFVTGAPDLHVVFGWLQVGEVYHSFRPDARIPGWAKRHPHIWTSDANEMWYQMSSYYGTVYVSPKRLELPGLRMHLPGGGVFEHFDRTLCLTDAGQSRSVWRLPAWMYPFPGKKPLTYHEDKRRWNRDRKGTVLRTVPRGQEFVLDCAQYPEKKVRQWLADLFQHAA
ncbi:MAG: hypothetical protein ABSA70_07950 [Terriglobia bacterium]